MMRLTRIKASLGTKCAMITQADHSPQEIEDEMVRKPALYASARKKGFSLTSLRQLAGQDPEEQGYGIPRL